MDRALLNYILCPICGGGDWTLKATESETIHYEAGAREEVRFGELSCTCGKKYPVHDYVLSFADLFPPDLEREASYWDRQYIWNIEQGAVGFHDLKQGFAPFMAQGVREAFPYADKIDRYAVHQQIAEHPLFRSGTTLLDMGVGLGWTSLHFARSGYLVTAFDPSIRPVQAAKSYAIEQGIFVEYVCAAVGYVSFRSGSFDNVTAFHSLHHVPDLQAGLADVQSWLRPGGTLAVDEHITNSKLAGAIGAELQKWAGREVFPRYRTISTDDLARLPSEPHSALEDAGAGQILPLVQCMFDVKLEKRRHVVLDHYPLLYYLWKDKDREAFIHALDIANHFQELLRLVDPDGGEYVTILAANNTPSISGGGLDGTAMSMRSTEQATTITPAEIAASGARDGSLLQPSMPSTPQPQDSGTRATKASADSNTADQLELAKARRVELEAALAEQGTWASQLEQALRQQNAEMASLKEHLKNVQNGRVLRLMSTVSKLKRRLVGKKPPND